MPGILVVALQRNGNLVPASFELLTAGRKLSDELKEPLCAAFLGHKAGDAPKELVEAGADKAFVFDNEALATFNDELHTRALAELCAKEGFTKILLPSSVMGRALAARLAVKLKAGLAADVSEVALQNGQLRVKRGMFSGNVTAEIEFKSPIALLTLQAMAWPRAEKKSGRAGEIIAAAFDPKAHPTKTQVLSFKPEESSEVDLGSAERIVSGGRGLGNADGFKLIRDLAHSIGAAIGASRAVVDSGWIAYRHQVGLTGRAVRPKLYIACGISGQIQHLAGMASSGTIVAINTDPDCPMMQIASISILGDLNELIPLMVQEIKKRKGGAVAAAA